MKIICTQENLKSGLLAIGKIISSANTLPILNNILIKTEHGLLRISSTNLELAISTLVRCKVEEEGGVTVVGKVFLDLINNLPNQNIIIQTVENNLSVEAENYHTLIKTTPIEEFPLIPTISEDNFINIDANQLKNCINQVVFAVSNNQTQPEISGVLFSVKNEEVRVVATDRYRLAEKKSKISNQNHCNTEAIIPQKTATEISRVISNYKGQVKIIFSQTQAKFIINNTEIISRLVDGQYPDYQQIIPSSFSTTAVLDKLLFVGALKTASVFSRSGNSVNLDFDIPSQQLIITAESAELGKSKVELSCKIDGEKGAVVLNHHYLLECLSGIEAKEIIIKIINDSSPSLVEPVGEEGYLYLVMPIKI